MPSKRTTRRQALAAAIVLIIGMGFGRFAFTGLYPAMIAEGRLSLDGGSYAASANYAGYLMGALALGSVRRVSSCFLCLVASIVTIVTLGALWFPLSEPLIVAVRGLAGFASAVAMVAGAQWLINDRGHADGAPTLFAGVGLGILLSAEVIAVGNLLDLESATVWLFLAAGSLVFTLAVWFMMRGTGRMPLMNITAHALPPGQDEAPFSAYRLIGIYGLAGLGYIITATYLPLLVRDALGPIDPVHVWAVFGFAAIPSCFLWHALHMRWGTRRSLQANLVLQTVGVVLPIFAHSLLGYMSSALLVGGTFMGTVTIAMPAARRVADTVRFNLLAMMTAAYGVGQIVGPLVASSIYQWSNSFDDSLMLAGAALVAAVMCSVARNWTRQGACS